MNIATVILAIIFIYVVNILFHKYSILLNNNGEKHQNYTSGGKVPLTGGIFLLALLTLFFYNSKNEIIIISLSFLFLLGISSDLKILNSPRLRILFQAIIVFSTIYIINLTILRTGIEFIDFILSYHYFNLLFVTFCILIVINGTNFIDGLNGLAIGYYSIILYQLVIMNFFISGEFFSSQESIILFIFFIIIFAFNILNKMFIGDSGSYLLGFIFAIWVVFLQHKFVNISPFYIILLLWYPCFENLFSIIRKNLISKSAMRPDEDHLHQLIFFYLKNKTRYSILKSNNLSSTLIILYNILAISIATSNPYSTYLQILIIVFSIIVYLFFYLKLFFFKYKKFNV